MVRARLDELEARLQRGELDCEALYVGLSSAFRTFMATFYGVAIQEQSTPEFVNSVLPELPLPQAEADRIRRILVSFDRVKFAQEAPEAEFWLQALHSVRALVDALERIDEAVVETTSRGAA